MVKKTKKKKKKESINKVKLDFRNKKRFKENLHDTQSQKDTRELPINKVGIRELKYPIAVKDKDIKIQHTVANISMYVDLPKQYKGTHMSRFLEIIEGHNREIHVNAIFKILNQMQKLLKAKASHIEVEFPFFMCKKAPISKRKSLMNYKVKFHAVKDNKREDFIMTVKVPVTTLCPCSKNISKYNAHNQRGEVTVSIRFNNSVWIEDVIKIVEESSSCDLYSLLKREDEKYVTEKAYENPLFVEDLVRNIVLKLKQNKDIIWYSVEAENFESIHNHNAYAQIESDFYLDNNNGKRFIISRY